MPKIPAWLEAYGGDLENPGSRFASRPAFAVAIPEEEWATYEGHPEEALRGHVGEWLFEEQEGLGRGELGR